MKKILLSAYLTVLASSALAADPGLSLVPPDLALVETYGTHRFLAFQVCSPEHCWNELFIQELEHGVEPKVTCSAAVSELNSTSDIVIRSAEWRRGPEPVLGLALQSSHEAFKPYTAFLSLKEGCKYKLQPRPGS